MRRRAMLTALSTGIATIAGCSTKSFSGARPTPTPEPDPSVSWDSEWTGDGYKVEVQVQMDGAEKVMVKKGTASPSDPPMFNITESGSYTVVGPGSDRSAAKFMDYFEVFRPNDDFRYDDEISSYYIGKHHSPHVPSVPAFLQGLNGMTSPKLKSDFEAKTRRFDQTDNEDHPLLVQIKVPLPLLNYYTRRKRDRRYGVYVSDTYDDEYISTIVDTFQDSEREKDLDDTVIINRLIAFVQNLKYTSDQVSSGYNEYPKYPIETLNEKNGDCEDTCILLASLLAEFGYGAALLLYKDEQHMALGIAGEDGLPGTAWEHGGKRYYYTETTKPGWSIGEVPPEVKGADPEIIPIESSPVGVFSFATETIEGGAKVELAIRNVGKTSGQFSGQVLFQDRSKKVVAKGSSENVSIAPDQKRTVTIETTPPDDKALRAKVNLRMNGRLHDTLTTDYREPIEVGPDA